MEELQFTTGEGPCVDASRNGRPVLQPDLRSTAMARWPGFRSGVLSTSVQAISAFPLQICAIRIGVLDLYRARAGELSAGHFVDGLAFADVVSRRIRFDDSFTGTSTPDPV